MDARILNPEDQSTEDRLLIIRGIYIAIRQSSPEGDVNPAIDAILVLFNQPPLTYIESQGVYHSAVDGEELCPFMVASRNRKTF